MIMAEFINTIDVLGDEAVMDSIIECTITEFNDDNITFIGPGKFEYCSQLEAICVPNVTTIDYSAFRNCTSLKHITADTFPKVTKCNQGGSSTEVFAHCTSLETIVWPSLEQGAYFNSCTALRSVDMPNLTKNVTFSGCKLLSEVNLPNLSVVDGNMFLGCTSLKYLTLPSVNECKGGSYFRDGPSIIDLPVCTKMSGAYGVGYTNTFKALILRSSTVCVLDSTSMFNTNTPLENGTGHIYVPRDLIDSYKVATNWSKYATSFRVLEDYTVDGTTTGAIREHCESITLDATELTFTDANSQTLTATGLGIYDSITWTSSDNKVARVRNGVITPISDGTATITVTSGDCSATCEVTVSAGLDGSDNILLDVGFNTGYLSNNGAATTTSSGDTYTDKFDISYYVGDSIEVQLIDVRNTASNSRICYYNENNTCVGYTLAATASYGAVITSTVPDNAVYAAISVNKSGGFSAIDIYYDGVQIGYIDYTS